MLYSTDCLMDKLIEQTFGDVTLPSNDENDPTLSHLQLTLLSSHPPGPMIAHCYIHEHQ